MNTTSSCLLSTRHLGACLLVPLVSLGALHAKESDGMDRLFTLKVLPVLSEKCFGCHGDDPDEIEGGLIMHSREDILFGGDGFENVLVPGDAEKSFMMAAVRWEDPDYEMPPKENDRLTEAQIKNLEMWINAGAPWPNSIKQAEIRMAERGAIENEDGILMVTSGGLRDDWTYRRYNKEDMWAFQPVTDPAVSTAVEKAENPVDVFIREKLGVSGFAPAPRADPITLIRRATYDLTGLPPSPEAIHAFLDANTRDPAQAWESLVDELLASQHFGERWAQHWLDVARYADTGGMSNDWERSNAWRYRDYVIRSFNEDKPYDQFVVEQLAGDELTHESVRRRVAGDTEEIEKIHDAGNYTEEEIEWMIASGFLRMGPWDSVMVSKPEARQIWLDDVVNSVGQTFLSTTMRCLKCHDHKFDPHPTRDYYRMYAAFSATQLAERPAAFSSKENRIGMEEGRQMVDRLHSFAADRMNALEKKREDAARTWYEQHDLTYQTLDERKSLDDRVKPPRNVGLDYIDEGRLKVRQQDDWIWERRKERFEPRVQSVYNALVPASLNARKLRVTLKTDPDAVAENFILTGGALTAPGEEVQPGVLSAIGVPVDETAEDPFVIPADLEGRRLALAQWMVDPRNSLTTRSIVNRIWQHHFGKPLAGNPNNFGAKGAKPTHPELLNYLASELIEGDWKLKRLHKMILLSETYQQSGRHPDYQTLKTSDPNNDLFAYHPVRRLTAEEIRDSMLAISGELNRTMGGLSIMPEINMEVALQPRMIQFSIAPAHQPSRTPEQRNRRSIYAYRARGQADPFLELFNQPNPNDSCEARDSASVSPQAFTLLNSDRVTDRSIAFALRLEEEAEDLHAQTNRAFELAFGRKPSQAELERLTAYVSDMRRYHVRHEPEPVTYPTKITRSLVEEFSGKPFEYEEILPVFEDYIPDKKAADVSPQTRALADLCLLLFNSHEFAFVY